MKITSYQEAREYLESFIKPHIFQKVTNDTYPFTPLDRMQAFLKLLDNPQEKFKSVLVTGTSGKGSTAYLLSRMLTLANYKTGLTTSPHLQKINERMQINGEQISDEALVNLVNKIQPAIEKMKEGIMGELSYFEILLALAFLHFAKEKVAIAIVEVGLEGKYDGTNVLHPLLIILTNISLDHIELLGPTIQAITKEAVSAIKHNKTGEGIVITAARQVSVLRILERKCKETHNRLVRIDQDFNYLIKRQGENGSLFDFKNNAGQYGNLQLSLIGNYQVENATLAIEAVLCLEEYGFSISEMFIRKALSAAFFPGRFEIVNIQQKEKKYTVILDGAHNSAKMKAFTSALEEYFQQRKKIIIISFKKNKKITSMLNTVLKVADAVIVTEFHATVDTEKNAAMDENSILREIKQILKQRNMEYRTIPYLKNALEEAYDSAKTNDSFIVVTGSLYLVGEARDILI